MKKQTESLFPTTVGKAEREYKPETEDELESAVRDVWDYWLHIHYFGRQANRPILDFKRYHSLRSAVDKYGVAAAKKAILGCSHSPWHSGQNPTGKKYNDVLLIFRDDAHVKKFQKFVKDQIDTVDW